MPLYTALNPVKITDCNVFCCILPVNNIEPAPS